MAVLVVIGYHLGLTWLPGGFLGVDLFFVLSGYLITGLLLTEVARSGGLDLGRFYARRIRRLFPAMAVLLLVFAIVALRSDPLDRATMRADGLSALLDVANWHFIASGASYFAQFTMPSALRHTWSLAIEEQFYLLWPLMVLAITALARGRSRVVGGVVAGLATASFTASIVLYHPGTDPSRVYFGTDTRAFTLLVGALLAVVDRGSRWGPTGGRRGRAWAMASVPAIGGMVGMFLMAGDRDVWVYRGGLLAFALLAAVVIGAAHGGIVGRVLSTEPLRWIGTISYGLYLWHWPLDVWLTPQLVHASGWRLDVIRVLATFGVAVASYYLVERTVRQGRFPRRAALEAFGWTIGLLVAVIAVGTLGARPLPDYLQASRRDPNGPILVRTAARPAAKFAPATTRATSAADSTTTTVLSRPPTRVLLLGDSVAASVQGALGDELLGRGVSFADGTVVGCGVVLGDPADPSSRQVITSVRACSGTIAKVQQAALGQVHPDLVLLFSTWEREDRIVDGQYFAAGTPAWASHMLTLYDDTISRVTAAGARVGLVLPPDPVAGVHGQARVVDRVRRTTALRDVLAKVAQRHAGSVTPVDLASIVCPGQPPCPPIVGGLELRHEDGIHFDSPASQGWVARRIASLLTQLDLDHLPATTTPGGPPASSHPPPN
ncbi:MAG: oatA 3 [Acidimicrobiales bacterium]|nr:oatA 3 [Acidimicrobiales bacterium]